MRKTPRNNRPRPQFGQRQCAARRTICMSGGRRMVFVAGRQVSHNGLGGSSEFLGGGLQFFGYGWSGQHPGQTFYTKSFLSKSFPSFSVRTFFCMSVMIRSLKTTFFNVCVFSAGAVSGACCEDASCAGTDSPLISCTHLWNNRTCFG